MEEGRGIREVSRAAYAVIKTGYTESDATPRKSREGRVTRRRGRLGGAFPSRPPSLAVAYDMWRCYGGDGSVARLDDWQQPFVLCNRKYVATG